MKGLIDLWWISKGLGQLTALVANFVDNGKVRTTPDDLGQILARCRRPSIDSLPPS